LSRPAVRPLLLRTLRRTARVLAAVAVLAVLAVLLLLLAPVRSRLLPMVLTRVDQALPGDLAWTRAAWPSLGRLELDGLLWTQDGDTLLAAPAVRLDVTLRPLLDRDVVLRDVEARGLRADVPAIRAALPSAEADSTAAASSGGFPRPGALPGAPSLALERARVSVDRIDLDGEQRLAGALLRAAVELRAGHAPFLAVDTLRVDQAPGGWRVPAGALVLRPDDVRADLQALSAAGDTVALRLTRAAADSFHVSAHAAGVARVDVRGAGVAGREPLHLGLALTGTVDGRPLDRAVLDVRSLDPAGERLEAELRAAALGWSVDADARILRGEHTEIALAPVAILRTEGATRAAAADTARGRIVLDGDRVDATGLRLTGELGEWRLDLHRDGDRVTLAAAADLPGPARFAHLAPSVRMDDWTSLAADLAATVELGGEPAWTATLDLSRTPWLTTGRAAARGRGARAHVDSLRLALPGLALTAAGDAAPDALDLTLDARLSDAAPLRRLADIPPDLAPEARVAARVRGVPETPDLTAAVRARVVMPAADVGAAVTLAGRVGPAAADLRLSPVLLHEGLLPDAPAAPGDARLTLRGDTLRVDGLRLTGDLGEVRADARRTPAALTLDLAARWDELPAAAARRLGERAPAWRPSSLTARAELAVDAAGAPTRGRVTADLDLPGPSAFQAQLPAAQLADLDSLRAALTADVDLAGAEPAWTAVLDLSPTPWLTAGRAQAHGRGAATVLDSLALALPGLQVRAAGRVTADSLGLRAAAVLPDPRLVARFVPLAPWADLEAALDLTIAGAPAAPRVTGGLQGRAATPQLTAEGLRGELTYAPDTTAVVLSAPQGLSLGLLAFQNVEARFLTDDPAAGGDFTLTATGDLLSLDLAGRATPEPVLELDALRLASDGRDLALQRPFRAARDGAGWRVEPLELRGGLGTVHGGGKATPDSLDLALDADVGLPLSLVRALAPTAVLPSDRSLQTLALTADLTLNGSPQAPRLEGTLGGAVRTGSGADDLALAATLSALPGRLGADLALTLRGRPLASGDALLPAAFSLDPPSFVPSETDSFHATLRTRSVELSELADYLPPEIRARGALTALADLRGVGRDADLDGFVDAPDLRLDLDDGSWLTLGGRLDVGGRTTRPSLSGAVTLKRGVVMIPDVPPQLLPAQGRALLLDRPVGEAPADTAAVLAPSAVPPVDLDLQLSSPGDLWLRGRGLSLQLRGDLRATVRDGEPAVVGELAAVEGGYRFLGTLFEVQRGVVTFYGDLASDPRLDLELISRAAGVTYTIVMQGQALAPTLTLSSDPEMTEGDIVASLLFGKPLDQLDTGQESLLKARTAQVLTSLGATQVSDRLSRLVGADLVAYNQAASEDEADSLLIGKYLSPKLLLKYEQFLGRSTSYIVRLDYALTRLFRLETSVGQGEESGMELKWARDY